jgi:hypothetical protein
MISIQKRIIQIIFFCVILPVFSEANEHENASIYSRVAQTTEYGEGPPIRIDRAQDIIRYGNASGSVEYSGNNTDHLEGRFFEISSSLLQKGYQVGIHYTNFSIARNDQLRNPYSGTLETSFSFNGIGLSVGADIVVGRIIFQPQIAGYGGQSEVKYNLNGDQLANKISLTTGVSLDFPISIRFGRIILGGTYKYIYIPTVYDTAEKDILNREVGDESIIFLLQSSLLLHIGIRW